MEINIKFRCGEIRKVYFYFNKYLVEDYGETRIYAEATYENLHFLGGDSDPFTPEDFERLLDLMRSITARLACIDASELENKSIKIGLAI